MYSDTSQYLAEKDPDAPSDFPKHFGVTNFVIYLRFVFWKGSTTSKDVHAMISWNLQISSVFLKWSTVTCTIEFSSIRTFAKGFI